MEYVIRRDGPQYLVTTRATMADELWKCYAARFDSASEAIAYVERVFAKTAADEVLISRAPGEDVTQLTASGAAQDESGRYPTYKEALARAAVLLQRDA